MSSSTSNRRGYRLSDGPAHQRDHAAFGRRDFLRSLGVLGTGSLLLNKLPVSALGASPLAAALNGADEDRVLVFIRLKGGNDGLNTFIPVHDFGNYQQLRPDVHIPRAQTVRLSDDLHMNDALAPLTRLWNDGAMRVVRSVGYPDQNLSHFRSSDIWATTSDSREYVSSGVLGRYLDDVYPDFLTDPPETPPAIQIGGSGNLLFNNPDNFNYALSTENPTQLYNIARSGVLHELEGLPECSYGEQLGYVRAVANTTFRYAGVLSETYDRGTNSVEYANDRLGDQLALVARLLRGGLGTRLFVVELDGFDTHATQPDAHRRLLTSVGENVAAFFADMTDAGQEDRVLAMTFSEFGRRIEQNGSMGTDHGAAAPLLVFGKGLNGNGSIGAPPDLNDTDEFGNLKFEYDFRSVYATVLSDWLCLGPEATADFMGAEFAPLQELGLQCSSSPVSVNDQRTTGLPFRAYATSPGTLVAEFELPTAGPVTLHAFDTQGRRLATLLAERMGAGAQVRTVQLSGTARTGGIYILGLEYQGRLYSAKVSFAGG